MQRGAINRGTRGRVVSLALARACRPRALAPMPAGAFAARVVGRYGVNSVVADPLERTLAIPRALAAVHRTTQHWHLAISPRVSLNLASAAPRVAAVAAASRDLQLVPADDTGPTFANSIVERVLSRAERVSSLEGVMTSAGETRTPFTALRAGALPDAARDAQADTPAASVPRVLRTATGATAKAVAASAPATGNAAVAAGAGAQSTRTPVVASTRAPAALDLDGLADRVVRVIDRRLTAQRERHGRI